MKKVTIILALFFSGVTAFSQVSKDDVITFFDDARFEEVPYFYVLKGSLRAEANAPIQQNKFSTKEIKLKYRATGILMFTAKNLLFIPYDKILLLSKGKFTEQGESGPDVIRIDLIGN